MIHLSFKVFSCNLYMTKLIFSCNITFVFFMISLSFKVFSCNIFIMVVGGIVGLFFSFLGS
jgi:hypothetical protein